MLTNYYSICTFLVEADAASLNYVTFDGLCERFHLDPVRVDRAFYSVLGMSGDEIIDRYKGGSQN